MKTPYLVLRVEDQQELTEEIRKKQDEFLDVYSLYIRTSLVWVREEVRLKAYELHILDPSFTFQF